MYQNDPNTEKPKLMDFMYCTIVLFKNKYSISGVQIQSTGFVESCLTLFDELFAYKCYCRREIIRPVYKGIPAAGLDCSERAMFSQLSF